MELLRQASTAATEPIRLTWHRFAKLTAARDAFRKEPCIYVTTDKLGYALRVGVASKGLQARYRGGTGYSLDAAMHDSGNLIFVASVSADLCSAVELELIWRGRKVLTYNNVGKRRPPARRIQIVHEGDAPNFNGFES